LFFNNLEEVSHAMEVLMVWLGLDCMYRLLPFEEFGWQRGATQALKVSLEPEHPWEATSEGARL
jgi:hypothetical protein